MNEYMIWKDKHTVRGVDVASTRERIRSFRVETPSWGYGNSGTRFKVFHDPCAARTVYEKLDDAAVVQKFTGVCEGVAIHIPWDAVDDYRALSAYA